MTRHHRAWVLVTVLLLAACGGGTGDDGTDDPAPEALDAATVCPDSTVREDVVVCTELQPQGDPLVLPADSASVVYGALGRGGERFLTRDGALELASSVTGDLVEQLGAQRSLGSGAAEDGDVAGQTGPYAQLVYRARVDGRKVESLTPVVRIDETALMTRIFGGKVLEGTIAPMLGPEEYDLDASLPVRIELSEAAENAVLRGRIVNASTSVLLSTGDCAPSLSAAGTSAPLVEPFTEVVTLQRFPSMHGPFNDEMLLKWDPDASNMGTELYPSAATVLGLDPLEGPWLTALHGNPTSGPAMTLTLDEGGGGTC